MRLEGLTAADVCRVALLCKPPGYGTQGSLMEAVAAARAGSSLELQFTGLLFSLVKAAAGFPYGEDMLANECFMVTAAAAMDLLLKQEAPARNHPTDTTTTSSSSSSTGSKKQAAGRQGKAKAATRGPAAQMVWVFLIGRVFTHLSQRLMSQWLNDANEVADLRAAIAACTLQQQPQSAGVLAGVMPGGIAHNEKYQHTSDIFTKPLSQHPEGLSFYKEIAISLGR